MRWHHIRLIFWREVRDQLRDRRTLFMVAALENDALIHEAPAIVGCRTPSALVHAASGRAAT